MSKDFFKSHSLPIGSLSGGVNVPRLDSKASAFSGQKSCHTLQVSKNKALLDGNFYFNKYSENSSELRAELLPLPLSPLPDTALGISSPIYQKNIF